MKARKQLDHNTLIAEATNMCKGVCAWGEVWLVSCGTTDRQRAAYPVGA